jgi:hypothetical protein
MAAKKTKKLKKSKRLAKTKSLTVMFDGSQGGNTTGGSKI